MISLTEDDKKLLTEFLGECWHEVEKHTNVHMPQGYIYHCDLCETHFPTREMYLHVNRSFTTWQDLGDLKEKLVKKGKWSQFEEFAFYEWHEQSIMKMTTLTDYLLHPSVFIPMVVKFFRREKA